MNIDRLFDDCFTEAARDGFAGEPWAIVRSIANLPDPIIFSSEEKAVLLMLKKYDLLNLILPMELAHKGFIDILQLFNAERIALTKQLSPEGEDGNVLSGTMTEQQRLALRPLMLNVNGLIAAAQTTAKQEYARSSDAANRLQDILRTDLTLPIKLTTSSNLESSS